MANQPEQIQYDAGVYQLETTDPVDGGAGAVSNKPLLNLSNRTAYLKKHVDDLESGATVPQGLAKLDSPAFTGSPTAPTQAVGDNSKKLANTEFAQRLVNGFVSVDVSGGANVTLTQAQSGYPILYLTGTLTANIAVIFPTQSGRWQVINATSGGFTLTCKTASGSGVTVTQGRSSNIYCDGSAIGLQQTDFASPSLTGSPTAPTQAPLDNSTLLASTAFVKNSGLTFKSITTLSASATLSAAHIGGQVVITGAGALTITLPAANSVRPGDTITIRSNTTSNAINTVKAGGSDVIGGAFGASASSAALRGYDTLVLCSDGVSRWEVAIDATASFVAQQFAYQQSLSAAVGASGYQKLPGGLIFQWGSSASSGTGSPNLVFTYPIAFPNATLAAAGFTTGGNATATVTSSSKTTLALTTYTAHTGAVSSTTGFYYIAIGF